jgi:hypothetical protein
MISPPEVLTATRVDPGNQIDHAYRSDFHSLPDREMNE